MRAGTLRYKAEIQELTTVQSDSGATKKTWATKFYLRCTKIRTQSNGNGEDVKEEFNGMIVTVQVRRHAGIKYGMRVVLGATTYGIELIDDKITENCIELTLKRLNL